MVDSADDPQTPDQQTPDQQTPDPQPGSRDAVSPSFAESMSAMARQSGFSQFTQGETPTTRQLLGAVGGIRGVLESILPGLAFLIIYLTTHDLLIAVLVPIGFVLVFAVARAGTRSSLTTTVAGGILLAISAVLVLITGKAVTNFVPGIVINTGGFVVMLISIFVGWPLIGIVVGLLFGDFDGWRTVTAKRRILTRATWLWVALFAIRLVIEVPLFLANNVAALGVVRLITSVPLYALVLWATWLLVRGVYAGDKPEGEQPDLSSETDDARSDSGSDSA